MAACCVVWSLPLRPTQGWLALGLLYQEYRDKSTLQEIETRRQQDAEIQDSADGSPAGEDTPEEEEEEEEEEELASPPEKKALPQICLLSNPHSRFNLWQDLPEIRSSGVLEILQPEEIKLQELTPSIEHLKRCCLMTARSEFSTLRYHRWVYPSRVNATALGNADLTSHTSDFSFTMNGAATSEGLITVDCRGPPRLRLLSCPAESGKRLDFDILLTYTCEDSGQTLVDFDGAYTSVSFSTFSSSLLPFYRV
ncbi:hypothetical protein P7K49_013441 [Saguinus oedipus]|uniref:Uncharacterized protein n=1 Tax=Saguinus oedipus TaxID=9490 RepID=A0ABQ9VGI0_SAGOE|nr:hypothetical protein P7K49_013441 [Saguinus oedipus]